MGGALGLPSCGSFMSISCLPPPRGFLGGSDGKGSACNAGVLGSILGLGRFPGEGNGYPLQHSSWRISRTEEPGGPQSKGHKESGMTE